MSKSLQLDGQLCFAVYAAGHAFTRFYKKLLEPLGLTYPQYLVLLVLWEENGLALKAIGARLGLDSGTLTPLLKRMEAAGLLSRERNAGDERQVTIALTLKGKRLEARAAGFPALIHGASGCTAPQLEQLRTTLFALGEELDAAA